MFRRMIISLSAAFLVTACANEQSAFRDLMSAQLQRYPAMQVQDLYKLVFQAALGNEHLMTDSARIHDYLIQELESIPASSDEPLLQEISPDGEVVRLNLRPFKAQQGDHRVLFQAMMQTARTFQKSQERLERFLRYLEQMAASGAISFDAQAMHSFFHEMRDKGYPAVHHSAIYEEKYAPAYRVILRKFAPPQK
ncbi:MAG: hypothetical protein ONB44_10615 [candidate division KSB1 bacterium]|nr:hypothetical protein [candidate division KSB1 bacterium]MDZ7302576.1 hypothetical protein [candidate division KSB1 bacterium]MDZ7311583.1 hypothetical protein [candidate division KSB1 bacterium]